MRRGIRTPLIGIKRPFGRGRFSAASFSIAFTGLSVDSLGAYGQIGNHANISYLVNGAAPDSYAVAGFSPPLVADFVNETYRVDGAASTFASMFTFARTSTATYVDSSGVLQTATSGTARIGHHVWNGSAWVNEGLLLESEARTNLLTYSQDFTNGIWSKVATTVALDETGPDGVTNSAATLTADSAGGTGFLRVSYTATVATSSTYTFSAMVKADTISWVYLQAASFTTPASGGAYFNLSNGTIGTVQTGYTASIEPAGNGFYRCSITFTTDAADTSGSLNIMMANGNGDINVARNGTNAIIMYGAQFELGATPSSYIPTAGAAFTRTAGSRTIPAANTAPGTTAISVYMDMLVTRVAGAAVTLWDWQADANNRLTIKVNASNQVILEHVLSGTTTTVTGGTISGGINVALKVAIRCTTTAANIVVNGTAATEGTTLGIPDLSAADITSGGMVVIGEERIWEAADIGDSALEALTA